MWNVIGTRDFGRSGRMLAALSSLLLYGCGPELTEPSSVDISGRWLSQSNVGVVTEIQFDVVQSPDGSLNGTWVGKTSTSNATCPPEIGTNPTNVLSGSNTLLQVEFELLGVGHFHGQVISANRLEGSLESCATLYPVEFMLVEALPASLATELGLR
jgi:hypothetical protein